MGERRKEDAPTFAEIQRVISFLQHARMSKERTALVKNALAACDAAPKNLQDRFMDDACAVIVSPLYAAGFQQPAIASALDAAERCGFAAGREAERRDVTAYGEHCADNERHRPGRYTAGEALLSFVADVEAAEHVGSADRGRGDGNG